MDLATTYGNYCGTKLPAEPPDFPVNYINTPEKFIILHAGAGHKSRIYDYWPKVVSLLKQVIDVPIIQVGLKEDPAVLGTIDYRDKTNLRQSAFLTENALLCLGSDSLFAHLSGIKKTPFVGLYANQFAKVSGPHYHGPVKLLESHRDGNKPSFSETENPKTINYILPEDIVAAAAELLHTPYQKPIKTIRIGTHYNVRQIDFIPDYPIKPQIFNGYNLACRFDISPNQDNLVQFLSCYSGSVVTENPIDSKILNQFRDQIKQVIYFLDKHYSKEFVRELQHSGVSYQLITSKKDKEYNDLKLDLFDFNQVWKMVTPDVSKIPADCYFESFRGYLNRGIIYPSRYHFDRGINFTNCDFKVGDALNDPNFQESFEHYYFYQKIV